MNYTKHLLVPIICLLLLSCSKDNDENTDNNTPSIKTSLPVKVIYKIPNGTTTKTTTYSYDSQNRLKTLKVVDANASLNLTQTISYENGKITSLLDYDDPAKFLEKFVFQNFGLIENMTVGQNVELPLLYAGISNQEKTRLVAESLEKVGLADFVGQSVKLLSGGQRQRVAIARAIVNSPKFIIADEPTGALDSKTSVDIMQLFTDLNTTSGVTIILVTHDPNLMAYCNREIRVSDGEVVL